MYPKYTTRQVECVKCGKLNNFFIVVVEKAEKYYYLTQCPRCKHYEEVRELSPTEVKMYKPTLPKEERT